MRSRPSRGYIFVRGEYVLAAARLERAIAEAKAAGYLGANVLGSSFGFELFVHTGAGRYIPGEETALISFSRGPACQPAREAPVPADRGTVGQAHRGQQRRDPLQRSAHRAARQRLVHGLSQGKSKDSGTKLYGVSGRVRRTGLGVAHGHHGAGDSRGACRRHERRPQAQVLAAGRRIDRFPPARTPGPRIGLRHDRQGRQPHGHRSPHGG